MNRAASIVLLVAVAAGCSTTTSGGVAVPPTVLVATSSSVAPSTSTTTSVPASTTSAATTTSTVPGLLGEETIGTSVQGRPITAYHRGTAGGIVVLVVGVIHGNENDGLAILDDLRTMPLPDGYDLWLLPAINPDGLANDVRGNGNQVDLNRNFPHDWTSIARPGEWQYSGSGPASEPETQAFMTFALRLHPALTLWYHQDAHTVGPSAGRDGPLRQRYAQLTGLDYVSVTGGKYTGVAATWVRKTMPDTMSFIIELGATLTAEQARVHADAVVEIMQMIPNV